MAAKIDVLVMCAIGLVVSLMIQGGAAIKCWECNSHYDRNCADPFQNATFAQTDCNMRKLPQFPNTQASVCRKIIQKVRDDYRFVRGCGWLEDEREGVECIKRAGTFNVLIQYCSCKGDGCNGASTLNLSIAFVLISSILATLWECLAVK